MPSTISSKKRVRQTETRTLSNRVRQSSMRTYVRKVREAVAAGDQASAQALLGVACQAIDKAARHNVLHDNTAANHKSKLTRLVNRFVKDKFVKDKTAG